MPVESGCVRIFGMRDDQGGRDRVIDELSHCVVKERRSQALAFGGLINRKPAQKRSRNADVTAGLLLLGVVFGLDTGSRSV